MKKLGTPNGAGPGNEKEKVGFPADGTPPEPRNPPEPLRFALALDFRGDGFFLAGFFLAGFFLAGFFLALEDLRVDGVCFFPAPEGDGGPEAPVEDPVEVVVVGTETELGSVDPVDAVPVDPVVLVDSVPVPVPVEPDAGAAGEHDSETPTTASFTGSEIDDNGVPAGRFIVKVILLPPATVTVIKQESA